MVVIAIIEIVGIILILGSECLLVLVAIDRKDLFFYDPQLKRTQSEPTDFQKSFEYFPLWRSQCWICSEIVNVCQFA